MRRFWFTLTALTILLLAVVLLIPSDGTRSGLVCGSNLPQVEVNPESSLAESGLGGFESEIGYDASKVCPVVVEGLTSGTEGGCQIDRREEGAEGILSLSCR